MTISETEAPNEKHNRIGREIIDKIFAEYPIADSIERFVVLESLLFAFISGETSRTESQLKILKILFDGVEVRLTEKRSH